MDIQRKQNDMANATLAAFDFETTSDTAEHQEETTPPIENSAETHQANSAMAERPCDDCRSRKKRCDRNQPQCGACVKRKITCHYSEPHRPLKRKRAASEASNQTTTSAEILRHGDVESLDQSRETGPSTRVNTPEAEVVAATNEIGYGLDEDDIAQMPYWKWMNRRKAFDADMERASKKLREQEAGRPRKDSVTEDDGDSQEVSRGVDGTEPQKVAEKAVSPERTAAQRVFGTYELLERILLKADMKTVLLAQRVDKTFQHVINRSTGLQQNLFFKAHHSDVLTSNPLFESGIQSPMIEAGTFAFDIVSNGYIQAFKRFDLPDVFSRTHESESWRRMLVAHPLSQGAHVLANIPASYPDFTACGAITYAKDREVRMLALWEELLRQQRTKTW